MSGFWVFGFAFWFCFLVLVRVFWLYIGFFPEFLGDGGQRVERVGHSGVRFDINHELKVKIPAPWVFHVEICDLGLFCLAASPPFDVKGWAVLAGCAPIYVGICPS